MKLPARIVIDLDGVLVDYGNAMWRLLRSLGATMRPFDGPDPDRWDWYEAYGATNAQIRAALATQQDPAWWRQLLAHRDLTTPTVSALQRLCRRHEVTFVSSRPCGRDAAVSWLAAYVGGPVGCQVVITPGDKVPALLAMQPDAIVEDRPQTLLDYILRNPVNPARCYLVDRSYNQATVEDLHIERVASTLKALQAIEEAFA